MFVFSPRRSMWFVVFSLLLLGARIQLTLADEKIEFSVSAGKHDRPNTPIKIEIAVDPTLKDVTLTTVRDDEGNRFIGQITAPGLLAAPAKAKGHLVSRELHFILPKLGAGESQNFSATVSTIPVPPDSYGLPGQSFRWQDTPSEYKDLLFNNRSVLRYMYHKLDDSTADTREATFKPYHHVYDPAGKLLLTKGPGGLFPHHHGVFYGFNKVTYDGGKTCDIWHCRGAHQQHAAFLASEAGPVLGRQLLEIDWVGEPSNGNHEVFAKEQRELTVFNTPGGRLIEFASRLTSLLPPIKLDGDPQHAGVHFRATQEVPDKTKHETYFVRPDGISAKGEKGTRNWPAQKEHVNLPWNAMSMVIADKRFTIAYLDSDKNPKEARYSERDYGRFGSYFVAEVTAEKPLAVNYRLWVQDGEMTVPQVTALDADFDDPPVVSVK